MWTPAIWTKKLTNQQYIIIWGNFSRNPKGLIIYLTVFWNEVIRRVVFVVDVFQSCWAISKVLLTLEWLILGQTKIELANAVQILNEIAKSINNTLRELISKSGQITA